MTRLELAGDRLRDARYALRSLAKTPRFTVTAIFVLSLSVCASVSMFTFADAALIRPLPYANLGRLVAIFGDVPVTCPRCRLSYLDYLDLTRLTRSYRSVEAFKKTEFTLGYARALGHTGDPETLNDQQKHMELSPRRRKGACRNRVWQLGSPAL